MMTLVVTTTDEYQGLNRYQTAGRKIGAVFIVKGPGGEKIPYCILEMPETVEKPSGPRIERKLSCFGSKMDIKIQLEKYKRQYGFYPSEKNWDAFLDDLRFWPPDSPVPRYCLAPANPYEYKSDTFPGSVLVTNEHGTGYSKYRIICTNPECIEYGKPEYWE